jgi:hypothetical protein
MEIFIMNEPKCIENKNPLEFLFFKIIRANPSWTPDEVLQVYRNLLTLRETKGVLPVGS